MLPPVVKQQNSIMKKKPGNFDKFKAKKSNAAIKEQFKQEKRKWKKDREEFFEKKKRLKSSIPERQPPGDSQKFQSRPGIPLQNKTGAMPLNKFIAHCGICSRRDAAGLVKLGKVKVNGVLITEPGHKVSSKDEIKVNGKKVSLEKHLVYILLNKPKDYITTTEDPLGRKTVLDLIRRATMERVYPVGRLDRNTSGVLLLTNDGELSQMLTHPSNEVKKVYAVTLDRPLEKKDFERIRKGVVLDDGIATVDELAYTDARKKTELGVEIHSGRNRIVRRIFEHLGYDVKNLDRVMFAGLTKKNIERGRWRFLTGKEVRELKYFSPRINRAGKALKKSQV